MKILKFGGSSLSNPKNVKDILRIVLNSYKENTDLAVVVSAFTGVTDQLIHISQMAAKGEEKYREFIEELEQRHLLILEELIGKNSVEIKTKILDLFKDLKKILHGIELLKDLSHRSLDGVMSFGERLSALIISEALKESIPSACYLDARELIITDMNFGNAQVNEERSYQHIRDYFQRNATLPVITGFIGSTEEGTTTTFGRGGSDLTATLFGAALNASEIEIWKDVDGVMTADPKKVPVAFPIPQMSFREALEMSHFGAKVLFSKTIIPAGRHHIPIRIKNMFNPEGPGTLITSKRELEQFLISGITSIDNIDLIRLEGSSSRAKYRIIARFIEVLAKLDIEIYMISQGSAELSVSVAIDSKQTERTKEALEREFHLEREAGIIDPFLEETGLVAIAAITESSRTTPGIAGKLMGALGKNKINVVGTIGTSACNVLTLIKREEHLRALNVIHQEFFPILNTIHLFVVGATGRIGTTLINQLRKQLHFLRCNHRLDVKIVGLSTRKKMVFNSEGLAIDNWVSLLEMSKEAMNIDTFINKIVELDLPNSVFVDCTDSKEVADTYSSILQNHISIVTPNKAAAADRYKKYKKLMLNKSNGAQFYYEANVGAGLPIISTITDLLRSGDRILKIEAILSGSLSYIFNSLSSDKTFSQALSEAQEKGFTEPDPREDLNGKDMARKLLILARELGYPLEIEDIQIEPILPQEFFESSTLENYFEKLKEYDSYFNKIRMEAKKENKILRVVGAFNNKIATVKLQAIGSDHPFYFLSGADNIIALTTQRYKDNPLVIKGPGAGVAVTAGEILADIIRTVVH